LTFINVININLIIIIINASLKPKRNNEIIIGNNDISISKNFASGQLIKEVNMFKTKLIDKSKDNIVIF
jgi:hypothetical protein